MAETDDLVSVVRYWRDFQGGSAWKPIETAPKDGSTLLLYCPDGDLPADRVVGGWWDDFGPYRKEMGGDGVWSFDLPGEPTHWMPLPEPPSA
jgi:hypothetical protein